MENQTPIFLPHGGYRNLLAYKKSDVIFQGTVLFCQRFLPLHGDRTVDQMKQAARSCKQNIAEGSAASGTSRESEIKLTNVARASLDELREDYLDFLKAHNQRDWPSQDTRKQGMRTFCRTHTDWADYEKLFADRPAETLCNLQLVLINQTRFLLDRLLEAQEEDFRLHGGIRERMRTAREEARGRAWAPTLWSWLSGAATGAELAQREEAVFREVRSMVSRLRTKNKW